MEPIESPNTSLVDVAPAPRRWRRALVWAVLLCAALVAVLTAGMAWVAQGAEMRLLKALEPHLATDVHVESAEVSLWSAWPDVEVRLQGVRVEDALERGRDFLVLRELGFRLACLPLLEQQLVVKELRLEGGHVRLNREGEGRENWQCWTSDGGDDEGNWAEWSIDHLSVVDVRMEGVWRAPAESPIRWDGRVESARWRVNPSGESVLLSGDMQTTNLSLEAAGSLWMDGLSLKGRVEGAVSPDETTLSWKDMKADGGPGAVVLDGRLSVHKGQTSLALGAGRAGVKAVKAVVPPHLAKALETVLDPLEGTAAIQVVSGSARGEDVWPMGEPEGWTGEWAVRVVPQDLTWTSKGRSASGTGGAITAHSVDRGWRLDASSLRGNAAGGEFDVAFYASERAGELSLSLEGQAIVRPNQAWAWRPESVSLPTGWSWSDGGQLRGSGSVSAVRNLRGDWQWTLDDAAELEVRSLSLAQDQQGNVMELGSALWTGGPDRWVLDAQGIRLPGADGRARFEWNGGSGEARLDVDGMDLDRLESLFAASGEKEGGASSALSDRLLDAPWTLDVRCGSTMKLPLDVERWSMQGRWKDRTLHVDQMEAEAFGGRVSASGSWREERLEMTGQLAGADLPGLLEGTSGLGQTTLLPRHVRGVVDAEGTVNYAFGRTHALPWDVRMDVHVEGGELVDFELLQEIPEVLSAERKYRMIADADDLGRRLKRVRFEPLDMEVGLDQGVLSVAPVEVASDAMDVGVEGWYRLGGTMDFTLDFALRDLKSGTGELGPVEEDGLGHRFFLSMGGTMAEPEFGYDRMAHQEHRKEERRGAWQRLKGVLGAQDSGGAEEAQPEGGVITAAAVPDGTSLEKQEKGRGERRPEALDDDDDY